MRQAVTGSACSVTYNMLYNIAVGQSKRLVAFRVDADLLQAMDRLHEQYGTSYSEQMRRALRAWLENTGALPKQKAERPRAATRKRS